MKSYPIIIDGDLNTLDLKDIAMHKQRLFGEYLWSARLSTGLFGHHDCKAGNRGPKDPGEILLYLGNDGLRELINDGFIPCPVCKPENSYFFWDTAEDSVLTKYALNDAREFTDKTMIGFDPRRLDWERLLPLVGAGPGRIYLPQGLAAGEITAFRARYREILPGIPESNRRIPLLGFYDHNSKARFTEYP